MNTIKYQSHVAFWNLSLSFYLTCLSYVTELVNWLRSNFSWFHFYQFEVSHIEFYWCMYTAKHYDDGWIPVIKADGIDHALKLIEIGIWYPNLFNSSTYNTICSLLQTFFHCFSSFCVNPWILFLYYNLYPSTSQTRYYYNNLHRYITNFTML